MNKKITMDDIAQSVGVSKNAVSLALRGMPGLSEEMRMQILDTADRMGYVYKKSNVSENTQIKNICIIVSMHVKGSHGFFEHIQYGIEKESKINKMNCILFCYDENTDSLEIPICITENMISGIICIGKLPETYFNKLQEYNIPIVLIDHYFHSPNCDCILSDNISGSFIATSHLIELGHKCIGFLGDIHFAQSFFDRWLGYIKALKTHDIPIDSSITINNIEALSNLKNLPTAFVCCNDNEAFNLINVLSNLGKRVPDDVSVTGFDNIYPSVSNLTTIEVSKEKLGVIAFQHLLAKIENPMIVNKKILIPSQLVIRNTTRSI